MEDFTILLQTSPYDFENISSGTRNTYSNSNNIDVVNEYLTSDTSFVQKSNDLTVNGYKEPVSEINLRGDLGYCNPNYPLKITNSPDVCGAGTKQTATLLQKITMKHMILTLVMWNQVRLK